MILLFEGFPKMFVLCNINRIRNPFGLVLVLARIIDCSKLEMPWKATKNTNQPVLTAYWRSTQSVRFKYHIFIIQIFIRRPKVGLLYISKTFFFQSSWIHLTSSSILISNSSIFYHWKCLLLTLSLPYRISTNSWASVKETPGRRSGLSQLRSQLHCTVTP